MMLRLQKHCNNHLLSSCETQNPSLPCNRKLGVLLGTTIRFVYTPIRLGMSSSHSASAALVMVTVSFTPKTPITPCCWNRASKGVFLPNWVYWRKMSPDTCLLTSICKHLDWGYRWDRRLSVSHCARGRVRGHGDRDHDYAPVVPVVAEEVLVVVMQCPWSWEWPWSCSDHGHFRVLLHPFWLLHWGLWWWWWWRLGLFQSQYTSKIEMVINNRLEHEWPLYQRFPQGGYRQRQLESKELFCRHRWIKLFFHLHLYTNGINTPPIVSIHFSVSFGIFQYLRARFVPKRCMLHRLMFLLCLSRRTNNQIIAIAVSIASGANTATGIV